MEQTKILKFMNELDKFITDTENNIETKDKEVSKDFVRVIETLMQLDDNFNLENMDLTKHLIIKDDGSFYLSDPLKQSILKN